MLWFGCPGAHQSRSLISCMMEKLYQSAIQRCTELKTLMHNCLRDCDAYHLKQLCILSLPFMFRGFFTLLSSLTLLFHQPQFSWPSTKVLLGLAHLSGMNCLASGPLPFKT